MMPTLGSFLLSFSPRSMVGGYSYNSYFRYFCFGFALGFAYLFSCLTQSLYTFISSETKYALLSLYTIDPADLIEVSLAEYESSPSCSLSIGDSPYTPFASSSSRLMALRSARTFSRLASNAVLSTEMMRGYGGWLSLLGIDILRGFL